jgi:hypothetical protein
MNGRVACLFLQQLPSTHSLAVAILTSLTFEREASYSYSLWKLINPAV